VRSSADRAWPTTTLLGRLAPPSRTTLLSAGTEIEQPPERPIIRQGDQFGHAYLLIDGLVKVTVRDTNGKEALLGIRIGGDIVGEMSALEGMSRSADVVPCGPLVARVIKREELLDLLARQGDLAIEVAKMISQRLRWANRRRLDVTAQTPRTRVARVLTEVIEAYGRRNGAVWELGVPLTQAEIAQLAGSKLRTVESALRRLATEDIVRRQYRGVEVTDLNRLRSIARG
jgi:CRP/FNR family transcriptional regulator, cyclic AMP receptor protein